MNARAAALAVLVVSPVLAQSPPYLREMPSVDRVLQAMRTADPDETAARQMGAFRWRQVRRIR